jgi:hypothetical protein
MDMASFRNFATEEDDLPLLKDSGLKFPTTPPDRVYMVEMYPDDYGCLQITLDCEDDGAKDKPSNLQVPRQGDCRFVLTLSDSWDWRFCKKTVDGVHAIRIGKGNRPLYCQLEYLDEKNVAFTAKSAGTSPRKSDVINLHLMMGQRYDDAPIEPIPIVIDPDIKNPADVRFPPGPTAKRKQKPKRTVGKKTKNKR